MGHNFHDLALANFLVSVHLGLVLVIQGRFVRRYPGLHWWTLGMGFAVLGFLTLYLATRSGSPPLSQGLLGWVSLAFYLGTASLWVGTRRFFGWPVRWWQGAAVGVWALVLVGAVFGGERPPPSHWLVTGLVVLALATAWILHTAEPRPSVVSRIFALELVAHSLLLSLTFLGDRYNPLVLVMSSPEGGLLRIFLLESIAALTFWTVSFIVLVNQRLANDLRDQASTDGLTGLANRAALLTFAHRALVDSPRQRGVCFVLVDLDHFKMVNDQWGHPAGDLALQTFARRTSAELGPGDLLARFGGDEFAVVLTDLTEADARRVVQRLLEAVSASPFDLQLVHHPVTVSLGAVWCRPPTLFTSERLFALADRALYQAKEGGRNRLVFTMAP